MNILCINTAFQTANIALSTSNGEKLSTLTSKHSESTLPEIEKMLSSFNLLPKDLDVICVNIGPGSFTGIRVGLSIVKGFSASNRNLKFVKVNSMELIAKEYGSEEFKTVLNALSGRFFVADFKDGKMTKAPYLTADVKSKVTVGLKSENLDFVKHKVEVSSQTFLELCKEKVEKKEFVLSSELEPLYLRKSQAEENLQGERVEKLSQRYLNDVYEISKAEFGSSSWSFKMFEEELIEPNRFSYCVTENGRVLSFINVLECEGENGREYNILNIASSVKNKGYATKLIEKVIEKAKADGIVNLWLEVDAENARAISLYQKLGFKQIAVRKKYYKNGNDALILRLEV